MQTYRNYTPDYGRRQGYNNNVRPESRSSCGCAAPAYRQDMPKSCKPDCDHKDDPLNGMALAMAYVPWQHWNCPYDVEKALCRGTIFEDLDKPFLPKGGMSR